MQVAAAVAARAAAAGEGTSQGGQVGAGSGVVGAAAATGAPSGLGGGRASSAWRTAVRLLRTRTARCLSSEERRSQQAPNAAPSSPSTAGSASRGRSTAAAMAWARRPPGAGDGV